MSSILDNPKNRVRLLKAGFTGEEIEYLATKVLDNNITFIGVNWDD